MHEQMHYYQHHALFREIVDLQLAGSPGRHNLLEGLTEYLAFKVIGPRPYRDQDFGFSDLVYDLQVQPEQGSNKSLSYVDEAIAAEEITNMLGLDTIARAFFQGDRSSINAIVHLARQDFGFDSRFNTPAPSGGSPRPANQVHFHPARQEPGDATANGGRPAQPQPGIDPVQQSVPARALEAGNAQPTAGIPAQQPPQAWRPSGDDSTLVVGGGHSYRQPLQGEVFLDIAPDAQPDILSDIRQTPIPDEHFDNVVFEHFPYQPLREQPPLAFNEAYRVLRPGGSLEIATGRLAWIGADERNLILTGLRQAGFTDIGIFSRLDPTRTAQVWYLGASKPDSGAAAQPSHAGGEPLAITARGAGQHALAPVRPQRAGALEALAPDAYAVHASGAATRARQVWAVDRDGVVQSSLQNSAAGADYLAQIPSRPSTLGAWNESLPDSFYNRRVMQRAAETPRLVDLYRHFLGPDAPIPPASNFARAVTRLTPHLAVMYSVFGDIHVHAAAYDARKGPYFTNLVNMAGRYSEILVCGIPAACGVAHYSNVNSPPLSYAQARGLDTRFLTEQQQLRQNYGQWAQYMRTVAQIDPRLAQQVDQAAFAHNQGEVARLINGIPDGEILYRSSIIDLAGRNPHGAANGHLTISGFNPADALSGQYMLETLLDNYHQVAAVGEITLQKEGVTGLLSLKSEDFDFDNPAHIGAAVRWLAIANAFGKPISLHSDWAKADLGEDGRLMMTSDHGYTMLEPLLDLIGPFADGGLILDHAGGGRFVNYDAMLVPTPDWLRTAYGEEMAQHILKMEEVRQRLPEVKFDISWNDNGIQFATNPGLRQGLVTFTERHPEAIMYGSDAVKPVNSSQWHQNLTTEAGILIEMGARDSGLAYNVLRGNFDQTVDGAYEMTLDTPTLETVAARLQTIADNVANPTTPAYQRLYSRLTPEEAALAAEDISGYAQQVRARAAITDGRVASQQRALSDLILNGVEVTDADGTPITITMGRRQIREVARHLLNGIEYGWINDTFIQKPAQDTSIYAEPSFAAHFDRSTGPDEGGAPGGGEMHIPGRVPDFFSPQVGTAAGAPWRDQARAQWMTAADGVAVAAGAVAGLVPFAAPAAGIARAGLFGRTLYRQELARRTFESIFEDGRGQALSAYVHDVVESARKMQIPEARVQAFVEAMMQLEVDATYVNERAAHWVHPLSDAPGPDGAERRSQLEMLRNHATMGVIGIGQIHGDAALGVQASSLLQLDPRTSKGRRHNLYISSSAATTITGVPATTVAVVSSLPPGAMQVVAGLVGGAYSVQLTYTQGLMIWQKLWANRLGRSNINPELNDRFRGLQTRILRGIEQTGAAGAANVATLVLLDNSHWYLAGANFLLDLGVAYTARQTHRIEQARVELEGATDPGPTAKAVQRLLAALGMDALASGVASANPEALRVWLDTLEQGLNDAGW